MRLEWWVDLPQDEYPGLRLKLWVDPGPPQQTGLEHNDWRDAEGNPYPDGTDVQAFYDALPLDLKVAVLLLVSQEQQRVKSLTAGHPRRSGRPPRHPHKPRKKR